MQRPDRNCLERRPVNTHIRYKQNIQWNQNVRSQDFYLRQNIQSGNFQHWCETCDKGFTTAQLLDNHKRRHQKCNIDGCQFVAHPKIITKHIQMQHSTGLFKRIAKLNNPEDIKKWREERKKKYPTIENIKKKEAAIKEKISRGEKMGIKYERIKRNDKSDFHSKMNNRQHSSQTSRHKQAQGKYNRNTLSKRKRVNTDVSKKSEILKTVFKMVPPKKETRKLKPFAGIQFIDMNDNADAEILETQCSDLIADDEDMHDPCVTKQNDTTISETIVCSALTSLIGSYGSSGEDDDDNDKNTPSEAKNVLSNVSKNSKGDKIKNNDKFNTPAKNCNYVNITLTKSAGQISEDKLAINKSNVTNYQDNTDDDTGPEETQIDKETPGLPIDDSPIPSNARSKKEQSSKVINRPTSQKYTLQKRIKLPSTLLEKLLHREIQQERNIILQCVRFVVKNNYFENT